MSQDEIRKSTLSFRFDESVYEDAHRFPVLYRSMNQHPRHQHPFWIYEAIYQQGELVSAALNAIPDTAAKIADAFVSRKLRRILFSGIGASYNLAASAAHVVSQVAGIPADFVESSDEQLSDSRRDYSETLVIGLSASGNSRETVDHIRAANQAGAVTAGFTNLDHTQLIQESQFSFTAPGGYGLIWDYTTRLAALVYLAVQLGRRNHQPDQALEAVETGLLEIAGLINQTLEAIDSRCQSIGEMIQPMRAVVVPAAGNLLPVASEMVLRFEEMAHFPGRARPVIDFLHGGPGLLADDIVMLLPFASGKAHEFMLRAARVAQAVKSPCVVIAEEDESDATLLSDEIVRLPVVHPVLRPFLYLLPAQLIPYYVEVARPGGNPDVLNTNIPRYARAFDIAYPPGSH